MVNVAMAAGFLLMVRELGPIRGFLEEGICLALT